MDNSGRESAASQHVARRQRPPGHVLNTHVLCGSKFFQIIAGDVWTASVETLNMALEGTVQRVGRLW